MKRILRKTRSLFTFIRQTVDRLLVYLACQNSFLSSLYYTFCSGVFYKEHKAALAGRVKYYRDLQSASNGESVMLRRNIHRLEKGIIMRPRKKVFGSSYIHDTVGAYAHALSVHEPGKPFSETLKWAHDVLKTYFSVTADSHSGINKAREYFYELPPVPGDLSSRPYHRDMSGGLSVDYSGLLQLAKTRRSVRWYRQQAVPREVTDKAIRIAGLSPSACNRQPFDFRIFDDPEKAQEIAGIAMGTKGFSHNFPGLIVVVGDLSAYFHERDRHNIYIDASLAAMSLIYALEVQGVSSCIINWPEIARKERIITKKLKLETSRRVIMLISIGYPDPRGMVPYSQKKRLDLLRTYNP